VLSVALEELQGFLFVGYVYAHGLSRMLPPRRAALVHLGFLALVALTLPLGLATHFATPPSDGVTLWLIGLFAASIGLPFVALSASAPLLQNWFVATGHVQARNPYVLYAASNLGSFCALLAYPFVIEPFLTLQQQIALRTAGFSTLVVLIAVAAVFARGEANASAGFAGARSGFAQRFSWVVLTAIPAGLSIAVTSYITTDLAAAPFLWIVPLALYLLTFVAVFRDRPWVSHSTALLLVPFVVAPLAVSLLGGAKAHWLAGMALNLTVFVVIALACHGEAYRRRPDAGRLTEFYLWTSFGGVVGGVFAGLAAPHLFNDIYEYPILIVAALLAMPGMFSADRRTMAKTWLREAVPVLLLGAALVWVPWAKQLPLQIVLVAIVVAILLQTRRPVRHVALVVLAFVFTGFGHGRQTQIETVRSFFGVHQVTESPAGRHHLLFHGTTIHGAELIRDAAGNPVTGRPDPLTYYYVGSPLSEAIGATRLAHDGHLGAVAAVGLGTGSLACYKGAGENWTFFEIDPEVVRIARNPQRFRFLSECAPNVPIVTGDARLTLAASAPRYNLIVLDAFSSDAIPVHLLTREAFAGYLSRLTPNGVITVHVSNKHMELASVVAKVGASEGLVTYVKRDRSADSFVEDMRAKSEVVVLARNARDLGDLPSREGWQLLDPPPDVAAWTDDYANVLAAIWRKMRGE